MACFVQIFTHTTVYSKIKDKKIKTFPYLPTQKLKNISKTDLFFSRPYDLRDGNSHGIQGN